MRVPLAWLARPVFGVLGGVVGLGLGCSGSDAPHANEPDAPSDAILDVDVRDAIDFDASDASDASDARADDDAPACIDSEPEPNDTFGSAAPLPTIGACDPGSKLHGVLTDASDVDHFRYQGNASTTCNAVPTASTTATVELCVFVACFEGATRVDDCAKGTPSVSPSGFHGCCVDGPGTAAVDFTCPTTGATKDADVTMRVRNPKASICEPYDVDYQF